MSDILERAKNCPEWLRQERKKAFKAFDVYKQNVAYGLVEETQEEHEQIKAWYNDCLNLNRQAIENVPAKVRKYL